MKVFLDPNYKWNRHRHPISSRLRHRLRVDFDGLEVDRAAKFAKCKFLDGMSGDESFQGG
jgi:hypothetical protein